MVWLRAKLSLCEELMRYVCILVLVYFGFSLEGCGKKSKGGASDSNSNILGASQLAFSVGEGVDPNTVGGYIVGKEDELKVVAGPNGTFLIPNMPEGEHDVIITGKSSGSAQQNPDRGIRLNKVAVGKDEKKDLAKIDLPKNGSVKGKVSLGTADPTSLRLTENLAGIDAYIPGTKYAVKSADDGTFTMDSIPVGQHKLYIEKDGYRRGIINIEMTSGETLEAPSIALFVDTGAEGYVVIQDLEQDSIDTPIKAAVRKKKMRLSIGATEGSTLMKVSACNDFRGKSWIPFSAEGEYDLEEECHDDLKGGYRLYIKFANGNGLESSPFTSDSYFRYNPISLQPTGIMAGNLRIHDIPKNASKFFLSMAYPDGDQVPWREEFPLQEVHENFSRDFECHYDGFSQQLKGDGSIDLKGFSNTALQLEFLDQAGQVIGKPVQGRFSVTCPQVQATLAGNLVTIKLSGVPERATHMRKQLVSGNVNDAPLEPVSSEFSETMAGTEASTTVIFYREGNAIGSIKIGKFIDLSGT